MRVELLTKTALTELLPKLTVAPAKKFEPLMVTLVPPVDGPVFGLTLVTVGGGTRSCACALPAKPNVNKSVAEIAPAKDSLATCRTRDFSNATVSPAPPRSGAKRRTAIN